MPYHFSMRWPRRSPSWCRSRQHSGVTTTPGTQWLRHQTDWCHKVQQGCLPSSTSGVLPLRFCVRSPLCQDFSSRRQTLVVAALAMSWQDRILAHRLMERLQAYLEDRKLYFLFGIERELSQSVRAAASQRDGRIGLGAFWIIESLHKLPLGQSSWLPLQAVCDSVNGGL